MLYKLKKIQIKKLFLFSIISLIILFKFNFTGSGYIIGEVSDVLDSGVIMVRQDMIVGCQDLNMILTPYNRTIAGVRFNIKSMVYKNDKNGEISFPFLDKNVNPIKKGDIIKLDFVHTEEYMRLYYKLTILERLPKLYLIRILFIGNILLSIILGLYSISCFLKNKNMLIKNNNTD